MTPSIVTEELTLLEAVSAKLRAHPIEVPPSEADVVQELVRIRDEIHTAKEEDKGALLTQYNHQIALLEQLRAAREREQVDPESPYFAHLKLEEDGRVRELCLGKATRIDHGLRIVDWRNAPVSRVFYRYRQGEDYEEELGDRVVEGRVVARRTLTIRHRRLERVDAPEGIFVRNDAGWDQAKRETRRMAGGEGSALRHHPVGTGAARRLGTDLEGSRRRVDKRLPDIAGLIDAEQFELITKPHSGVVVVRGTAGSGKTTVALHRIAWMAYEDPEIDSDRTLLVVFSRALRDYVDHVLPALGVHRVAVRTFGEWVHQIRRRHFPKLPRALRDDTPSWAVRLKQHPVLLHLLESHIERTEGHGTVDQAIDDWASVLSDPALLWSAFRDNAPAAFTRAELERVSDWCRDRVEEVIAWLDGAREEIPAALDVEDESLLLRAYQLRVGPLRSANGRPLRYRHVAVDEVQDFSPLEVRVLLGCLDERQSVTLAGDTQQHVMRDAGFTSWTAFFDHLGLHSTAVNTLKVAYRSTAEIVSFAQAVLGDLVEDDTPPQTTRTGPPVELFRASDHGACVALIADALAALQAEEPMASVALLTASPEISEIYYQGLVRCEVPRIRRVADQDFTFTPGVDVTEITQVKGLEFDYVILVEVNAGLFSDDAPSRRLLHVGATRAVHQLWITSVGNPSPILRQVLGDAVG